MVRSSLAAATLLAMIVVLSSAVAESIDATPQFELMNRTFKVRTPTGSGTAFVVGRGLDGRAKLITCCHVVDNLSTCQVVGQGLGFEVKRWRVKVAVTDKRRDLALLLGPSELASRGCVRVERRRPPAADSPLLMSGFPLGFFANTPLKAKRCVVRRSYPAGKCVVASSGARHGNSGSAVVDPQMRLVGVAAAVSDKNADTIIVWSGEVDAFLTEADRLRRDTTTP